MITYVLQLTICWFVFYTAYYIILRQETHFSHSRWYLLTALTLGLLIPLVDWATYFTHQPESLGHIYIAPFTDQMAEWDITVTAQSQRTNWYEVFMILYAIGAIIAGIRLILGWTRIRNIRRQSRKIDHGSYTLVLTDQAHLPFSFMGDVYCSAEYYRRSQDIDQILAHEEYHIRARHSMDILFTEILKIVFWFHPMIYLYKKELQQIHEYQADHAAYQLSSKKTYGKVLLNHVESLVPIYLANHFFNSQLKNRFKMMTKKDSNRLSVWKYLVMVPLIAMTVMAFSYSRQGISLLDTVMILQDTIAPPPPPQLPPPPPPPSAPPSVDEIHVVGYPIPQKSKDNIPPPPPPPRVQEVEQRVTGQKSVARDEVFRVVEEMPRFPGCEELADDPKAAKKCADGKMLEFLYTNIKYPARARSNGVEGNVVVQFIVEKDGSISNPKVIRDPDASLSDEAIRLVNLMIKEGKWTPGKQRGQNVRVVFILPIKFELKKESPKEVKVELHSSSDNSQPLLVLDDVVLGRLVNGKIDTYINPNDIERINVLKDETATEKYGPDGSEGVIEIYTKWKQSVKQPNLNLANVNLYPVPASEHLNFTTDVESQGQYKIEIRNLNGQIMKEKNVNVHSNRLESSLELGGLNAGPYYLVVTHQGKVFSKAFVKQ